MIIATQNSYLKLVWCAANAHNKDDRFHSPCVLMYSSSVQPCNWSKQSGCHESWWKRYSSPYNDPDQKMSSKEVSLFLMQAKMIEPGHFCCFPWQICPKFTLFFSLAPAKTHAIFKASFATFLWSTHEGKTYLSATQPRPHMSFSCFYLN